MSNAREVNAFHADEPARQKAFHDAIVSAGS